MRPAGFDAMEWSPPSSAGSPGRPRAPAVSVILLILSKKTSLRALRGGEVFVTQSHGGHGDFQTRLWRGPRGASLSPGRARCHPCLRRRRGRRPSHFRNLEKTSRLLRSPRGASLSPGRARCHPRLRGRRGSRRMVGDTFTCSYTFTYTYTIKIKITITITIMITITIGNRQSSRQSSRQSFPET